MIWHEGTRDLMDPLLAGGAALVAHGTELRPNDGVSTVESARWGRFRGCIPADHLDQVGQINDEGPDRRTGFDYLRFYRNIAFELAEMGY
jgi:triacylglycerol lipase